MCKRLGKECSSLIKQVKDLRPIDYTGGRHGHGPGTLHKGREVIEFVVDIHVCPFYGRLGRGNLLWQSYRHQYPLPRCIPPICARQERLSALIAQRAPTRSIRRSLTRSGTSPDTSPP